MRTSYFCFLGFFVEINLNVSSNGYFLGESCYRIRYLEWKKVNMRK